MQRLAGKVAIITGGANGIGLAAGKLFAEEGARVVLVDVAEEALRQAVQTIGGEGVSYAVADVSRPEQAEGYVRAAVERHGGLDILLANAGIEGVYAPIAEYPVEVFDRVMAVNLRGVFLGLKYAIPAMRQRGGGSIVITSSVAGIHGSPGVSAYATSKHAVIGVMRTAALECAAEGIRVNTVNPAPVETRMMRSLEAQRMPDDPEQSRRQSAANVPMKRYGLPEEIARVMLFLASDESRFCTGGVYMVDGGISAR